MTNAVTILRQCELRPGDTPYADKCGRPTNCRYGVICQHGHAQQRWVCDTCITTKLHKCTPCFTEGQVVLVVPIQLADEGDSP